jgi:hypothetical protein
MSDYVPEVTNWRCNLGCLSPRGQLLAWVAGGDIKSIAGRASRSFDLVSLGKNN